ncbi:DUF2170 family protein [Halomonas huangheensis]|uniref:Cytoplasmic protein n=1 Tax=Halomonas huangheensis TaxID=1178482 RepID=W1NCD9_9GAMM|nr:DUF2170 family protein [Halomonas huangheensis]ALM52853.1 cytoplasmic protein [Halomonas huangheensis]ERL53232.1 hypothetical protein BJB45_18330 [Halomonas huangheensis]
MAWELESLSKCLSSNANWNVSIDGDCLSITDEDGLDAYVAISGDQILVETLLFATDTVTDVAALNEQILRTHQFVPLTTVAITAIEGQSYYMAFGALSARSTEDSVLLEVETLFANVPVLLQAYAEYLN